jgi:hypothetical protein
MSSGCEINRPARVPLPSTPDARAAGTVCFLPVAALGTSYHALRPGAPKALPDDSAWLPLRVVPVGDEKYEVLDGFKRLDAWIESGESVVPVVLERPGEVAEHLRLMLRVNAPPRTITALDESRVLRKLVRDLGYTEKRAARALGHDLKWAKLRLPLDAKLSKRAQEKLADGTIGPTLAHALCPLAAEDQDELLAAIERHGVGPQKAIALIETYERGDEVDRRELLRDPLGVLKKRDEAMPQVSPRAKDLERRMVKWQRQLAEIRSFRLPNDLAPAERRRLEAVWRGLVDEVAITHRALGGVLQDAPPPTPRTANHQANEMEECDGRDTARDDAGSGDRRADSGGDERRGAECGIHQDHDTEARGEHAQEEAQEARRDLAGGAGGDHRAARALRQPRDSGSRGPVAQDRAARARGGGPLRRAAVGPEQARPIPRADQGAGRKAAHDDAHPARDPRPGIPGWPHHLG